MGNKIPTTILRSATFVYNLLPHVTFCFFTVGYVSFRWADIALHSLFFNKFELQHDKTNKMTCGPSEVSDQPGHPSSLISHRCLHKET